MLYSTHGPTWFSTDTQIFFCCFVLTCQRRGFRRHKGLINNTEPSLKADFASWHFCPEGKRGLEVGKGGSQLAAGTVHSRQIWGYLPVCFSLRTNPEVPSPRCQQDKLLMYWLVNLLLFHPNNEPSSCCKAGNMLLFIKGIISINEWFLLSHSLPPLLPYALNTHAASVTLGMKNQ